MLVSSLLQQPELAICNPELEAADSTALRAFHRFSETANRSILCFDAIPDGKPLSLFLELL